MLISSTAMQVAAAALVFGLAVAILVPAPAANEDGLLTALLLTVCCGVVLMGALALAGVLTATAVLAATGAAIMVPCAWLARAPEAPWFEEYYEEEDDDGGGSPPAPCDPSPTPGPEHWRPAPAPVAALVSSRPAAPRTGVFATMRTARTALAPAAAVTPAPTAAIAPAAAPNPRFPYLTAVAWNAAAEMPAAPVEIAPFVAPAPVGPEPVAPAPLAQPLFEAPAVRLPRGEHPSVEHIVVPAAPVVRRRRHVTRLRVLHGWRRRRRFTQSQRGEGAVR